MNAPDRELVLRARAAAASIAPLAAAIEEARRLPKGALDALAGAGVFKLIVPRAFGGAEATLATLASCIEEIARADGSAGWVAMIGATSGLMSVFVDAPVAHAIYGAPDAITCGVFAPTGMASKADGGYRVSGRWAFASGCEHSAYRMGGTIAEGDAPLPSGAPDVRSALFHADDTRVDDTWHTSGLRGTGSHDLEVKDVFVPASHTFSMITGRPKHDGATYRLPVFGILATGVAAVTVGIARAAVDSLVALATAKQPLGARRSIANRELVQITVASAEAKARGARALLHDAIGEIEREAANGGVSLRARAVLRAAACHATTEAAAAVDLAYNAGGGTSIYEKSALQRHFRDVHVATQHIMVAPTAATLAGRVLLGLESDTSVL